LSVINGIGEQQCLVLAAIRNYLKGLGKKPDNNNFRRSFSLKMMRNRPSKIFNSDTDE
jgi:hypothetical protein